MRTQIIFWLFFIPFCLINSNAHISVVNGYCLDHQRSMLLHLKNSLIFYHTKSSKLVQWNRSESDDDCCQWHGVTCNKGLVIALDLSDESISGGLNDSSPLFNLQHLESLNLALNDFHDINIPPQLHKLKNLRHLNLSAAGFEGQIPEEISHLRRLVTLDLSSPFTYNLKLEKPNIATLVQNLTDITELYLDGVALSAKGEEWGPALSSLEKVQFLSISSCKLSGPIHSSLANLSKLISLDISNNKMEGSIPSWIWQLDSLASLDLSNNLLMNFEGSFWNLSSYSNNLSKLISLDISSNKMEGSIPSWIWQLDSLVSLNLSNNLLTNFEGSFWNLSSSNNLSVVDLSYNQLQGPVSFIPKYASTLILLDLSHNNYAERIPKFFAALSSSVRMLSLDGNKLQGHIPDTMFPASCTLRILDLSDNLLRGPIPKSLVNCQKLQVLNLGKNALTGRFPCFLSNISTLGVMGLGSNKFQGSIGCPNGTNDWEMLHIVDLSNNHFSGTIPGALLSSWKAMTGDGPVLGDLLYENVDNPILLKFLSNMARSILDKKSQDSIFMFEWLGWRAYVDMSSNNFEGTIPNELIQLEALYALNLSHNSLMGHIPSFIGNLMDLESLDLSNNYLAGRIPFDFYGPDSFFGNEGLCGPPLSNKCNNEVEVQESPPHTTKSLIEWNFLSVELGFIVGFGMFIFPLIYWKKWRLWYSKHVDELLYRFIHKLDFQYVRHEGKTYRVLRWVY